MIKGLKPYTEYKESGLPWIGELPTGWYERRSRYLFREAFAPKGQPHNSPAAERSGVSRVAPPWVRGAPRSPALKGRNKPASSRTNDACGMNRFVSPFQG